jgi:Na+-driven multidrug efflux pump
MFFVRLFRTALSDIIALVFYLLSEELPRQFTDNDYDGATVGRGFFLVAGAAVFFAAGAFSMCLDDAVRTATKGLCRRRTTTDGKAPYGAELHDT